MKWNSKLLAILVLGLLLVSCTEDIVIDLEKGDPMIGVEASFSNELKCHEAILSYTADFYNKDDIRYICGATVYVTDGVDTVYYYEDAELKGHYFTELVAGNKNTSYRLCVDVPELDGEVVSLFAESLLPDNVDNIDSLVIKPFNGIDDTVPSTIFSDTIEWVYPYFQSLPDPNIIYIPSIYKNDTLLTDTLTQSSMIPVGGYAGYYINGPEMQMANKEIPVYAFRKRDLKDGDRVRVDLCSIPVEYVYYYYSLLMSMGSNPMMGAPSNVSTNIQPEGLGVGWFMTSSVVSVETIFKDE
jgi:hypothetical protein